MGAPQIVEAFQSSPTVSGGTSERVRALLEAGDLADDETAMLRRLDKAAERVTAIAEDLLDAQESDDVRAAAEDERTVALEELRPRLLA